MQSDVDFIVFSNPGKSRDWSLANTILFDRALRKKVWFSSFCSFFLFPHMADWLAIPSSIPLAVSVKVYPRYGGLKTSSSLPPQLKI